jgi:hypothetical protein
MKELLPFNHTPDHQPKEGDEVSFRLKPLDQRGLYEIQSSFNDHGVPSWDGIVAASRYIVGWKGDHLGEFSRVRVRDVLRGAPDSNWMAWLGSVTGALYRRAILEDDAAKKS